jgi:hypothetical protein
LRHASHSTIGSTTKPCANVSEFAQVRTMEPTVPPYSSRIATSTAASAKSAWRHVTRTSGTLVRRAVARRGSERLDAMSADARVAHHPRLLTMCGPRRLAMPIGRRFHSAMNARYLGFAGLFCGTVSRL